MDGTLKKSLSLLARGVSSVTSLVCYITDSLFCSVSIAPTSCRMAATLGKPPGAALDLPMEPLYKIGRADVAPDRGSADSRRQCQTTKVAAAAECSIVVRHGKAESAVDNMRRFRDHSKMGVVMGSQIPTLPLLQFANPSEPQWLMPPAATEATFPGLG